MEIVTFTVPAVLADTLATVTEPYLTLFAMLLFNECEEVIKIDIGISINENYEVTAFFFDNESGDLRISISDEILTEINQGHLFKYQNNELIRDTNKEDYVTKTIEIETLKQKLIDTDYIVTKSMEYQLTGKPIPDEYNQILNDRDSWRKQINNLQSEIGESN